MDEIARIMTVVARLSSIRSDATKGTAWGPQTYVHIRWVWFSLPLVLLMISLAFLIAAILQSRLSNVDVWKTSALAVLMHGLRNDVVHEDRLTEEAARKRYKERDLMVRLREERGRWKFSQHISTQ